MTTRAKQTAIAATAALALASGVYALGSQADDGSAQAARAAGATTTTTTTDTGPRGWRDGPGGPGGPGLDTLAQKLGVSVAKLQSAFQAVKPSGDRRGDRRAAFTKALATELGVSTTQLTAALDKLRPPEPGGRHGDGPAGFAKALGAALGIDAAKVRAALDANRPQQGSPPSLDGLAKSLGVSTTTLQAALQKVGPPMGPGHGPGGPGGPEGRGPKGPPAAALAKELGLPPAKVTAALTKLRASMEKEHAAKRAAFTAALAKQLGIPQAKVAAAFASLPHDGPGDRP